MSSSEILKKYDSEWERLSAGKHYYDIPITIRRAFFTHACMAIQFDVEEFIQVHGYNEAIGAFGESICRFIHFGKEPGEF